MKLLNKVRNVLLNTAYSIPVDLPHVCRPEDADRLFPNFEPERPLDMWIGTHIFKLPGIGYYGPTTEHGGHTDYAKCETQKEVADLYKKHWKGSHGTACWREVHIELAFWKENWGPLVLPDFSTQMWDAQKVIERMVQAGMSYASYTVPGISSVASGWTVAFKYSVYPPAFDDVCHQAQHENEATAICFAAKKAYEEADPDFKRMLDTCAITYPGAMDD